MNKLIDLTGQTFGNLTVLERDTDPKRKAVYWICQCTCGNVCSVYAGNLKSHHTTSCGCAKGAGIVGKKIGKLLIIDQDENGLCQCKCECGNYCVRTYKSLIQKTAKNACCGSCADAIRKKTLKAGNTFVAGTMPAKLHSKKTKANKSGVVGVNWDKSRGKWQASIKFKGKKYNLGRFDDFSEAVEVRKEAEKELFGNFLK